MFDEIANGLSKHKLVPFFGAGVSASHLDVLWQDVSNEMADAIEIPADRRGDFLRVADDFVAAKGEAALADLLRKRLVATEFDDVKGWCHLFLLSLNAGVLYTTNQDNLFELAASKKGRPHRIVSRLEDLAESNPSEALLFKYHGDLDRPETIIFTGASYEARIADPRHFLNIRLQADLLAKGFLFIGYSFRDPNVHWLFRELRAAFGEKLPPSYMIAYRYDQSLEELHREYGVRIVDPSTAYPDARSPDEAFKRYLKALSERVLQLKSADEIATWFTPAVPPSVRVATEFDVEAVVAAARQDDFDAALSTYRSLLDETLLPDGRERGALAAFRTLCDKATSKEDLKGLAAAAFNFKLPAPQALEALSRLMVAVNRIDRSRGFPDIHILSPDHGDALIPLAAALSVAEIQRDGDVVLDGFRRYASVWLATFPKLPPEQQKFVREMFELAWAGTGSRPPDHLFQRSAGFEGTSFDEIAASLTDRLPRMLRRPPE